MICSVLLICTFLLCTQNIDETVVYNFWIEYFQVIAAMIAVPGVVVKNGCIRAGDTNTPDDTTTTDYLT